MKPAEIKTLKDVINLYTKNKYKLNTRPYELNILGVRSPETKAGKFDDRIFVFYKNDSGTWEGLSYAATTDPGTYYLNHPMSSLGTAILKQGQYINTYQLGLHKGKYKALVQVKPVSVYRDLDRNSELNWGGAKETTGLYGINIHRARSSGTTIDVADFSAGCQVIADINDYNDLIAKAEKHAELYGNSFNYTLIDERELEQNKKKNVVIIVGFLAVTIPVAYYFVTTKYKNYVAY